MSSTRTQQATPSSSPNHSHSVNPVGEDGFVRCYHNKPVNRLTSKSDANPGREFYTCFKSRDDPEKCKFFKWADELPGETPVGSKTALPSAAVTPRAPSKRPREMEVTPVTPNVSPSKAAGNAAFKRTTARASMEDDDDDDIFSDEEILQFLSSTPNDAPPAKRFRFQKVESTNSPSVSPYKQAPITGSSSTDQTSPSKTPKTNQWEAIQDDPENPFHARAAALRPSLNTPSSTTNDAVTPESITKALDLLLTVPETVKRLQRKLAAAEQSRDAKARTITGLQKEIQNLKNQVRSLEETVEALRARR